MVVFNARSYPLIVAPVEENLDNVILDDSLALEVVVINGGDIVAEVSCYQKLKQAIILDPEI